MQIINSLKDWQTIYTNIPKTVSTGFVATMGALHAGHVSLVNKSLSDNDITVVSIFVNPAQFNKDDDFANYPKTLEKDTTLLQELGVDYCLIPNTEEVYADNFAFTINESKLSLPMEGKHRPGHFNGVLTVVMKLLNLVKPQRAYFGEKDYQQYQLIAKMVESFFMNIEIIACPIVREGSGLALSSRNSRLDSSQLETANMFAHIFHQKLAIDVTKKQLEDLGITVEYIEEHGNRRYVAVLIGDVRLIDNVDG